MKETLLEKAKRVKIKVGGRKASRTDEEIELVLGYLRGEVTYMQIMSVMVMKNGSVSNFIGSAIIVAYRKGRIKIL